MKLGYLVTAVALAAAPITAAGESTAHYAGNESGVYAAATALGFNVHDTGMSTSTLNALPAGTSALAWVGIGTSDCSATVSSTFKNFVTSNATNPKFFGVYVTDEPVDGTCAVAVKAYTDYLHSVAPAKRAFIVLTDYPDTYAQYRPAVTGVDLVGLDPYPVRGGTYNSTIIPHRVNAAQAAGIPLADIVPVFQTFSAPGYDAPTTVQLTQLLNQWASLIPS